MGNTSIKPHMCGRHRDVYHPVVVLAVLATIVGCGGDKGEGTYTRLFPDVDTISGVEARDEIVEYRDSTLYDFLNGGAELYFDYNIVAVASGEYLTESGAGIEVSVYDMGSQANAFGIYSTIRYSGAEFVAIGNEAVKTASSLDFWKGHYYCRLLSFDTAPQSARVLLSLGKALAANITETGAIPALVGLLPPQSRIARSEKYFQRHLALNNIHYVDPENVLSLSGETEGVVAQYRFDTTDVTGFIISYPTGSAAGAAYDLYLVHLGQKGTVTSSDRSAQVVLESGEITFVAVHETYILGVWDARNVETGHDFVENVLASIEKTPD